MKNGLMVILVGAAALAQCVLLYHGQSAFIANSTVVQGTIDSITSRNTTDGREYSAIITYQDANGSPVTVKVEGASTLKYAQSGEAVDLRIDNTRADNIEIDSFWQLWGTLMMVGDVALVCIAAGIALITRSRTSQTA